MDLHTIREEAAKQGFAVIPVRRHKVHPEDIINMACVAVGIQFSKFFEHTREGEVVFARSLAFNTFVRDGIMMPNTIAETYNIITKASVYYLIREMDDIYANMNNIKHLKEWQRMSYLDFIASYEEYKKNIIQPLPKKVESHADADMSWVEEHVFESI